MKNVLRNLILFAVVFTTLSARAGVDSRARKRYEAGLKLDVKVLSQELFEGARLNVFWNRETKPAYFNGLFTRYDRYRLSPTLDLESRVLSIGDGHFTPGLKIRDSAEVIFARQFRNARDAFWAEAYYPTRMPITAERALNNLNPGDFFSFKAQMDATFSLSFLELFTAAGMAVQPAFYAVGRGAFEVQILRLPNDQIRLKLIALRSRERGFRINSEDDSTAKFFLSNTIDRLLIDVLNLNPINFVLARGNNNVFMVDYNINLKDPAVAQAYNEVFKQAVKFVGVDKAANFTRKQVAKRVVLNMEPLERIFVADREAGQAGRITREFKGGINSTYKRSRFAIDLAIFSVGTEAQFSTNEMTSFDPETDNQEFYRIDTFQRDSHRGFLFSLHRTRNRSRVDLIANSNATFDSHAPESIVNGFEFRDRIFSRKEFQKFQRSIQRMIPLAVYSRINFGDWASEKRRPNVAARNQLVVTSESILALPPKTKEEIKLAYRAYLATIPAGNPDGYPVSLPKIAKRLAVTFDATKDNFTRMSALMELRKNGLFQNTGLGFLLSLMPITTLENAMHFSMTLESTDGTQLTPFEFGNYREAEIYSRLRNAQLIVDGQYDLLLQAQSLMLEKGN